MMTCDTDNIYITCYHVLWRLLT